MKSITGNPRYDFRSHASPRKGFADSKKATRAGDGGDNGVSIQGLNASKIDNFNFPTFGGKQVRCPEGFMNHGTVGYDSSMLPCTDYPRLAYWQRFLTVI
mgnify:CR=1 FL=1